MNKTAFTNITSRSTALQQAGDADHITLSPSFSCTRSQRLNLLYSFPDYFPSHTKKYNLSCFFSTSSRLFCERISTVQFTLHTLLIPDFESESRMSESGVRNYQSERKWHGSRRIKRVVSDWMSIQARDDVCLLSFLFTHTISDKALNQTRTIVFTFTRRSDPQIHNLLNKVTDWNALLLVFIFNCDFDLYAIWQKFVVVAIKTLVFYCFFLFG